MHKEEDNINLSVIVPCRNERDYIAKFIKSVLSQEVLDCAFEIIVADGMSDDGSREILNKIAAEYPRIVVIDNPERNTPCALNHAIRAAQGEIIIRMDVHTEYAADYIQQCVAVLEYSGADNVGGPWHAVGARYLQRAIALAFQSPFSSGGARSHDTVYEGEVDSVYLGCWKKTTLARLSLFDEELIRNQDDELNLRIVRSGGKVWQSPKIKSWYHPRGSLFALFRQYMQYGYFKVRVIQKHKLPASIRHIVPALFVGGLIALAVLSPVSVFASWAAAFLMGAYSIANLTASVITCRNASSRKYLPVMPAVFAAYHFGYGYGFLRGVIAFALLRKGGHHSFVQITRG